VPLIVIEGCDGSGKTTVANELVRLGWESGFRTRLSHCGPPGKNPFDEYTTIIDRYDGAELLVCDRLHVGEWIYGPVLRGGSRITFNDLVYVEQMLDYFGAVKVMLDAPVEVLERRAFDDRGEGLIHRDQIRTIQSGYGAYFRQLAPRYVRSWHYIDTTLHDTPSIVHELMALATGAGEVDVHA
jgi:thymidylate kinase